MERIDLLHIRIIALVMSVIIALVIISACSTAPAESSDVTADAPSTDGFYTSVENGNGIYLEAVVEDGQIEIDWYLEGDDSALYWKGSFEVTNDKVISEGDTAAMDASIMGSGSDTKEFWFEGDELCFELTALGHTQTIRMER